jgi:hypothetical protein
VRASSAGGAAPSTKIRREKGAASAFEMEGMGRRASVADKRWGWGRRVAATWMARGARCIYGRAVAGRAGVTVGGTDAWMEIDAAMASRQMLAVRSLLPAPAAR